jgi:hypothetical protein
MLPVIPFHKTVFYLDRGCRVASSKEVGTFFTAEAFQSQVLELLVASCYRVTPFRGMEVLSYWAGQTSRMLYQDFKSGPYDLDHWIQQQQATSLFKQPGVFSRGRTTKS